MTDAKTLKNIRTWMFRETKKDTQFITHCLQGTWGETVQTVAEEAIDWHVENDYTPDAYWSVSIVEEIIMAAEYVEADPDGFDLNQYISERQNNRRLYDEDEDEDED